MNARGQDGDSMPVNQVVKEAMTIIVVGHEATASTLNMIWYLLSQNQEVEMRLPAELSGLMSSKFPDMEALANFAYTRLVIDEVLRLYPPGWLMTRRAIEDDYLGEYYVPAGTEVCISPYVDSAASRFAARTRVSSTQSASNLQTCGRSAQPLCCRFRRARGIASAKSLLAPRCKCTF